MNGKLHRVCILLGSNIAPQENLPKAVERLRQFFKVESVSAAWETPSVGAVGPNFLNAAMLLRTNLDADQLKNLILRPLEAELGRVRTIDKFAPRTIDMDIVSWDGILLDENLWQHAHAAVPVSEVIPTLRLSYSGESLQSVARRLARTTYISPRREIISGERGGSRIGYTTIHDFVHHSQSRTRPQSGNPELSNR
jgi:2-amino-4-hydroxy-6-hydroxymethyldihydropteridine diphosphokinase